MDEKNTLDELRSNLPSILHALPDEFTSAGFSWNKDGKSHSLSLSNSNGSVTVSYSQYGPPTGEPNPNPQSGS